MSRQIQIVATLSRQSKLYFSDKEKHNYPAVPRSIKDCNRMIGSDSTLLTHAKSIVDYTRASKIPNFVTLPAYSLVANKGSIMKKKCCNCPNDPVPPASKNRARSILESFLRSWIKKAEDWIKNPEGSARQIKQRNIFNSKIRTKRTY